MIAQGTRLGPYEIQSALGSGGMGEVYKATDRRLDRTVAIKVLPEHVASDPDLKQRFEREAKTLAALSHPHICPVFDVGSQNGIDFLVMEYLEGETLERRLKKGALPLDQALQIGIQITDALATAHRAGIVHRDLKPGNIMLTKSGAKLLDFGLAKTGARTVAGSLSMLPTTPPGLTVQGTILGTFQYMAPEQLEGQQADARTDIFAFGAVLYEIVTGKKAFEGKSQASLIGAILKDTPPPPSTLQPLAPAALDAIVGRCLAKEPADRWQSAADLLFSLRTLGKTAAMPVSSTSRRGLRPVVVLGLTAGIVLLVVTGSLAVRHLREALPTVGRVQFAIGSPNGTVFQDSNSGGGPTISPDGRMLALLARSGDEPFTIWIRDLRSEQARQLLGTSGASSPFWSPDSRSIAYFDGQRLMRVDVTGGAARLVVTVPDSAGGAWNREGVILVGSGRGGIRKLEPGAAALEDVTQLAGNEPDSSHRHPRFLPDGVHFLFFGFPSQSIYVGSLDGEAPHRLDVVSDSNATYATSGHLLFTRGGVLLVQPFDAQQLRTTGGAFAVAQDVSLGVDLQGRSPLSVSDTGTLMQFVGPTTLRQLSWSDRKGAPLGTLGEPAQYRQVALSRDGGRIAVEVFDAQAGAYDIWIVDSERGLASRITADPVHEGEPTWAPDGNRLMFQRLSQASNQIVEKTLTTGAERIVFESSDIARPETWSPDGRFVLVSRGNVLGLFAMPMEQPDKLERFVNLPGSEDEPEFSPDGTWVAFNSLESGRPEVYVQPFRRAGEKIRVSDRGGVQAHWRADGRELFYLTLTGDVVSVEVAGTATELRIGQSTRLFTMPFQSNSVMNEYAISGDGRRFLTSVPLEGREPARILVTLNWAAALVGGNAP